VNNFIDTSAFLAVLDFSDKNHKNAKEVWETILTGRDKLVSHNYILVETSAIILKRLGMEAIRVFEQDITPILHVIWVTEDIHRAAVSAHLMANRRTLSLVDCVSFEVMRRTGIRKVFAFDRHFKDYGYDIEPR
jgi:predicted nucleic acid-binding protein